MYSIVFVLVNVQKYRFLSNNQVYIYLTKHFPWILHIIIKIIMHDYNYDIKNRTHK